MTEESLQQLKKNAEEAGDSPGAEVLVSADQMRELIQRVETAEQKVVWLERKKRTIADLAAAAHRWHKAKHELADKRILHIEEVLDSGQGVYDGLTDETEFKRGYRAALYWFRSEILDDPNFAEVKKAADGAKD
jgi:hypothetical protein